MGSSARPTQTEGTARRRGRRPASEVSGRSILLETAQRHFSRCGFGGTSLRAIARDADVTPALVCQLSAAKRDSMTRPREARLRSANTARRTRSSRGPLQNVTLKPHLNAGCRCWFKLVPPFRMFLHCSCMRSTPCLKSTTMGKAAFRALLKNWCGLSKEPPCPY